MGSNFNVPSISHQKIDYFKAIRQSRRGERDLNSCVTHRASIEKSHNGLESSNKNRAS